MGAATAAAVGMAPSQVPGFSKVRPSVKGSAVTPNGARVRLGECTTKYSHDGPIRRRERGYILTMDQSDVGSVGIFSRWTNQMQDAQVYSHDGPIRRRERG
eukprot:1177969-Prorocentrum_minimum.AAC.3